MLWWLIASALHLLCLAVTSRATRWAPVTQAVPPALLGNCTCPKHAAAGDRQALGESFLVLPLLSSTAVAATRTSEVVLTFFASDEVLLAARSLDFGTSWSAYVTSATNWTGSAPRCTTPGFTYSSELPPVVQVICTASNYPTGAVSRTASWDTATGQLAWENTTTTIWTGVNGGGIRHTVSLSNRARVLCMLQSNGWNGTAHFPAESLALYSDPPYTTWHRSSNTVRCAQTPGSCYGAVEPVAAERADGSLLALMRSQVGVLWQASSTDGGESFSNGEPSHLASTDSPPFLLRLTRRPTATLSSSNDSGNSTGALLLVWVNVRTTAPLVCEHKSGGGVYTIRHLLHAAISLDGGVTWRGHREIYRDPLMQAEPPSRGDIGVAYSYGQELANGDVLLRTGQGVGRTQLIRLDPSWLLVPTKHADFTTPQAAATWNRPQAVDSDEYVSTCMYYRHIGHSKPPESPRELSCGEANDGTALRMLPETGSSATNRSVGSTQALCSFSTQ